MTAEHSATAGVSVVVPVRGRVAEVARLLQSLHTGSAHCAEPVEVILVDDSPPEDARQHAAACVRLGARYARGPRHVGAKRNLGVRLASYDLVLFTDSDCRVAPDLLATYAAVLRAAPPEIAALAGPTLVEDSHTSIFRIMRRSYLLNGDLEMPLSHQRLPWATTSNLCVRRAAFLDVGGFVEQSLTHVCGEDVDLGLRLTDRGYVIGTEPRAVVTHDRTSSDSLRSVCRRLFMYGRSEQWLATVHPQRQVARWNPVTAVAAAVVMTPAVALTSVVAGVLLVPVVATAAVVLRARRRLRPGDGLRGVFDAVACAALDCVFDAGASVAAVELRRPGLLFAGFNSTDIATPSGGRRVA
jgi:GT2 family glycosyltransferase